MKKLMTLIALICVLNAVALAGLAGFLSATGRLDKKKLLTVADILKAKQMPPEFREKVYDMLQPSTSTATATAPSTETADVSLPSNSGGESASERLAFARRIMEQDRIQLENQAQELRHRQELLMQMQGDVDAKLKKIETEKKAYDTQVAANAASSSDESFQKSLALYDELKPKQIKEMFKDMQPTLVAKYLQAMDPSRAGKIMAEFKSPDETAFVGKVMETIRSTGTANAKQVVSGQ